MKNNIQIGQIVCSTQGRDEGAYYIVLTVDSNFCFVADGEYKKINAPKKKNIAHLRATPVIITEIAQKIGNKTKINDQMIYHSLYEYKKRLKGVNNGN
jgi:ribosomal protein L14E/L6E/L27E